MGSIEPIDSEVIVRRLRSVIAGHPEVAAAWLFGSVARRSSGARSDVDVAVLLREDPPPTLAGLRLDLQGDLEEALGRPVELVVLNKAPCDLVYRVLRDGLLLVEHDRRARVRFEVRRRQERFDVQPHLDRYRRPRATR